jgi:hypothetical protein
MNTILSDSLARQNNNMRFDPRITATSRVRP